MIRFLVLLVFPLAAIPLSAGASRSAEKEIIDALNAARTLVDGFEITGIIDRNNPGIMLDRKHFVKVGQSLDSDGKTVLLCIDPEPDSKSKPRVARWRLTFESKSGERFSLIFPKPPSPEQPAK